MLRYLARRVVAAIPIVAGILILTFTFLQLLPGDPVLAMMSPEDVGQRQSAEYLERRRRELGLDGSILTQFTAWVSQVARGNLGTSFQRRIPVADLLAGAVLPSAQLALFALLLAVPIGIAVGIAAARRQNTTLDYASASASALLISIPTFFLAILAIYVFAIWLGVLPVGGTHRLGGDGNLLERLRYLVLPASVLAASLVGPYIRFTRQSFLEVMHRGFVTTARAKGLTETRINYKHILRNALIPLVTILGIEIPTLLSGVLIVEVIFARPGLGRLAYESVIGRDYPVVIAFVLLGALFVMGFNLLADIAAAGLDPRIRL